MGLSPRILPINYGNTINSIKRILRDYAYQTLAKSNTNYVIVDYDLKSCYTTILLGL